MSWSTLGSNQWVSFNDMIGSGYPLNSGQSHTTSDKWITKSEAITKYNINPSLLASYTNPQWITKPYICIASGTLLSSTCVGCNIVGTYADGNCGTYTATISSSDSSCGTWNLEYYCSGCDKYSRERNTCSNATRNDTLVASNSTYCGGCCGQSTAANYSIDTGRVVCHGCTAYPVRQNSNSCYTGSNIYRDDFGTFYTSLPANSPCNTSANYSSAIGTLCTGCTNYTVYQNTNPCFTGNQYYANGTSYASNPSTGSCNTSVNYSNPVGTLCISCTNYTVYQNSNPCFTGNQYYTSYAGGTTYSSNPSTGGCNTSPSYTNFIGYKCDGCTNTLVFQNTNPCFTGSQYWAGDTDYSYNPVTGACDTTPSYSSAVGTLCTGCTNYTVYQNTNPCFGGPQYYANGASYSSNPSTGSCDTSANWVTVDGFTCVGCDKYTTEEDVNPCSSTYTNTRAGSLVESNSAYCGCGNYTIYWTFDNSVSSPYRTFYIYVNGSPVVTAPTTNSGSFTVAPTDTIRFWMHSTGIDGATNTMNIYGGYTSFSSNNTDSDIDTGNVSITGDTWVDVSIT